MKARSVYLFVGACTALLAVVARAGAQSVTEFRVPTAGSQLMGITAGPDGNLWFTEPIGLKIGRITPDSPNTITEFWAWGFGPNEITAGPDGNLWFTEPMSIGRITPRSPNTITHFPVGPFGSYRLAQGITKGHHCRAGRQPLVH